jgi:hypothetical protein
MRRKLPVQLARRFVEPVQTEIKELYDKMLTTLSSSAIGRGEGQLLRPRPAWPGNPTDQNFIVIQWQAQKPNFDLIVVNLAPHRGQCCVSLAGMDLAEHDWSMLDLLGEERFERSGKELLDRGLFLDLPTHGAQLFHFEPVVKEPYGSPGFSR